MIEPHERETVTFAKEFSSASMFGVEAETTGYGGGDAGHGGYLKISLRPMDSYSAEVLIKHEGGNTVVYEDRTVHFVAKGDCEIQQLVSGLEFLATKLRKQFPK